MCLPLSQASVLSDSRAQIFHPIQPSEQKTAGKAMCWRYFHDKRCISKYLLNWDTYVNSLGSLRMALLRIILNFCFKAKKRLKLLFIVCVFNRTTFHRVSYNYAVSEQLLLWATCLILDKSMTHSVKYLATLINFSCKSLCLISSQG